MSSKIMELKPQSKPQSKEVKNGDFWKIQKT